LGFNPTDSKPRALAARLEKRQIQNKMKRNTPKATHIAAHATFPSLEINP
jgi:hypothetical protein